MSDWERPSLDDALKHADAWRSVWPSGSVTIDYLLVLADEVRRLRPVEAAVRTLLTGTGREVLEACETLRRLISKP